MYQTTKIKISTFEKKRLRWKPLFLIKVCTKIYKNMRLSY